MKLTTLSITSRNILFPICLMVMILLTRKVHGKTEEIACEAREVILESKEFHKHGNAVFPQHVAIHRCNGGSSTAPKAFRCVPTATEKKKIEISPILHIYSIPDEYIEVENHTQCEMKCACERFGEKCKGGPSKVTCNYGLIWDKDLCECKPNCLKTGEQGTPKGDEEKTISLTVFIIVLVIEFIIVALVTFFIIDALKCKKHSKGVIHRTAIYVRSLSTSEKDNCKIPTMKRNRTDTGSVSFLHEVNQDNNSNYRNNNLPISNV